MALHAGSVGELPSRGVSYSRLMRLTVESFLVCSCGACLFICAKYCCFHLGSLQQGMSSFNTEPDHCSKHSRGFKKATECAVLHVGLGRGF